MSKNRVGIVGARGMVGSVLLERMIAENDFKNIEPVFLSTSQAGEPGPKINGESTVLQDAYDTSLLKKFEAVITCQGSDYTNKVHPALRSAGWQGFWIDSSSSLRNKSASVLLLDPVNGGLIKEAINGGVKDLIGANCTVGTMLMGLSGLFKKDLVEWANPSTYQAVSGAGAKNVIELLEQMQVLSGEVAGDLKNPALKLLDLDRKVSAKLHSSDFPVENFGYPIAGNVLPWVDSELDNGQSREEAKAQDEANKILGTGKLIPIDGTCVRVGSFRSHAQAVTIKLKKDLPLGQIEEIIASGNEWVKIIPNHKEETLSKLTPVAVSGTLDIAVGRLRKLSIGPEYISVFVVGDQLLWGAAEPLRRALRIIIGDKL